MTGWTAFIYTLSGSIDVGEFCLTNVLGERPTLFLCNLCFVMLCFILLEEITNKLTFLDKALISLTFFLALPAAVSVTNMCV